MIYTIRENGDDLGMVYGIGFTMVSHISNASQDMVTLKSGHPKISWLIIMLLIWGWVETNEFTVFGGINIWLYQLF